jgi:hypothetical protein
MFIIIIRQFISSTEIDNYAQKRREQSSKKIHSVKNACPHQKNKLFPIFIFFSDFTFMIISN